MGAIKTKKQPETESRELVFKWPIIHRAFDNAEMFASPLDMSGS